MNTNVYAKFRCIALHIKKALGSFRELTTTTTTTRTTRVAFWDPPSGPKIIYLLNNEWHENSNSRWDKLSIRDCFTVSFKRLLLLLLLQLILQLGLQSGTQYPSGTWVIYYLGNFLLPNTTRVPEINIQCLWICSCKLSMSFCVGTVRQDEIWDRSMFHPQL